MSSCTKEEIILVSDYEDDRLVIDGLLTDIIETQSFKVSTANNLTDSAVYDVSNVLISISSNSEYIPFNLVDGNQMVSQFPFKAWPDTTYTINYCYNGICGQKDFVMPRKISAEEVAPASIPGSFATIQLDVDLTLSSSIQQWCRLEAYKLDSIFAGDSIWTLHPQPIYKVFEVNASNSEHYLLPDIAPGLGQNVNNSFYKIKCYSLSDETGKYLNSLNEYMQNQANGNQFQNPPNFFDNGTLGVMYGSVMDSVYVFY